MPSNQKIHLRILHGVHDIDMVDDVVPQIKESEVIFFELVGSAKIKDSYYEWAFHMTMHDEWADAQDMKTMSSQSNPIVKLVWEYRKSRKLFIFIDSTTKINTFRTSN